MNQKPTPADQPYDPGDIVHIYGPEEQEEYEHQFGCEIIDVHPTDNSDQEENNPKYSLWSFGLEQVLGSNYSHEHLVPSPRSYRNIDEFLGDQSVTGERLLGKFRRGDLQLFDKYLTAVDVESDPTKDWLNMIQQENEHRINSLFAELSLLYYLRKVYGHNKVTLNVPLGEERGSKDFDLRLRTQNEDIWIEVVKPDHVEQLEKEGPMFGMGTRTGNSISRKLEDKFKLARDTAHDDVILVLAVYQEEGLTQGFEISRWIDEGYYDIGELSDGWITYTHLADPHFNYGAFSENGMRCSEIFENLEQIESIQ
ncbi:hypothetical protein [Halorubrum sp. 48-1-W]|uniref:hypothetical protein n=1 Tax=Halorubrum sp. 48-1-W TaxID=2249761 RepID=UPI000FCACA79|nr:hypothetical protein [Halorubrum sp. 48-1-W]